MTFSDLEWPFNASRAISAVAELLVFTSGVQSPRNLGHRLIRNTDKVPLMFAGSIVVFVGYKVN